MSEPKPHATQPDGLPTWGLTLARWLRLAEEAVYILIGALLVLAAVGLLFSAGSHFVGAVRAEPLKATLELLDTLLLVLMLAEILYTVVVTLMEHVLVMRPFLIIALIAAVRRILVITAQQASLVTATTEQFNRAMLELALVGAMIFVLIWGLVLLTRHGVESSN